MAISSARRTALILGGLAALSLGSLATGEAQAEGVRRPLARPHAVRVANRPLTIRRRAVPVAVAAAPGFVYAVPQHRWDDPRLYYFGPFRVGGDSFYGDQAGNPITRGNAGLGMIDGYGGARGGYGGPHFDAVGGFHNGPGPDAKIDADYASGSISRPDYADIPVYPSVRERVAQLNQGVVSPSQAAAAGIERGADRRALGGRTAAEFDVVKARFAAPMERHAPFEAAFANGGLSSMGLGDDAF